MIVVLLVGALIGAIAGADDPPGRKPGDPPSEEVPEIVQAAIVALRKQHAAQLFNEATVNQPKVVSRSNANTVEAWLSAKQQHQLATAGKDIHVAKFRGPPYSSEVIETLRLEVAKIQEFISKLRRGEIKAPIVEAFGSLIPGRGGFVGAGGPPPDMPSECTIAELAWDLENLNFSVTALSDDKKIVSVTARRNHGDHAESSMWTFEGWPPVVVGGKAHFKGVALAFDGRWCHRSLYDQHPVFKAAQKELAKTFSTLEKEVQARFKNRPK